MLVPIFRAKVKASGDRGLVIFEAAEDDQRRRWLLTLASKDDGRIEVVFRRRQRQRTIKQSNWWKGIAVPAIGREVGAFGREELEQLSHDLLIECFSTKRSELTGNEVPVVSSSADLTTVQFSELIEWAPRWCLDKLNGFILPLPQKAENG